MEGADQATIPIINETEQDAEIATAPEPKAKRKFPMFDVCLICLLMLAEAMSKYILFPFVPFMVEHQGVTKSDHEIGYYSGALTSAALFGQAVSCHSWGAYSDRKGRRPVLLFGLVSSAVTLFAFGFCNNYWIGLVFRLIAGLTNGNLPVSKTILGEVCTFEEAPRAFAIYSFFWYAAGSIAPLLGGALAQPAEKFPGTFGDIQFFHDYPFFLPCAAGTFLILVVLAIAIPYLPETLKVNNPKEYELKAGNYSNLQESHELEAVTAGSEPSIDSQDEHAKALPSVWKNPQVIIVSFTYAMISLNDILFLEVFPLWAMNAKRDGGLGFDSLEIGIATSISLLTLVIYLQVGYTYVQEKLGILGSLRYGMLVRIPLFILPVLATLSDNLDPLLWTILIVVTSIVAMGLESSYVSVQVFLGNCTVAQQRGAANAVGVLFAAVVRFIGPLMGGVLWSLSEQYRFPMHEYFVFTLVSIHAIYTAHFAKRITLSEVYEEMK
eukprot:TRINITY_DN3893_c0_g1_i7.p1 TRINITY_DN3893_c0_g1~~TRINITY_DN3893_c0_g1_i7.p1  ORF type:complete len:495 (+),score=110.87 TRINITY_DN3893_c0_g1_i7:52-1536(+)